MLSQLNSFLLVATILLGIAAICLIMAQVVIFVTGLFDEKDEGLEGYAVVIAVIEEGICRDPDRHRRRRNKKTSKRHGGKRK